MENSTSRRRRRSILALAAAFVMSAAFLAEPSGAIGPEDPPIPGGDAPVVGEEPEPGPDPEPGPGGDDGHEDEGTGDEGTGDDGQEISLQGDVVVLDETDLETVREDAPVAAADEADETEELVDEMVAETKAAGVSISADDVDVVEIAPEVYALEHNTTITEIEMVSLPDGGAPLNIGVETSDEIDDDLVTRRGPGAADILSVPRAHVHINWANRKLEVDLFTAKMETPNRWDPNSRQRVDLWAYAKQVIAEPTEKRFFNRTTKVKRLYLSAWPTRGSRDGRILGWNGWEPSRSSSGRCDTLLEIGVSPVSVPLSDCDGYKAWRERRGGVNYGPGAMGITYDQGIIVRHGPREAGMLFVVKVKRNRTPYWNDRLDVTMSQTVPGGNKQSRTCRTYAYTGNIRCSS